MDKFYIAAAILYMIYQWYAMNKKKAERQRQQDNQEEEQEQGQPSTSSGQEGGHEEQHLGDTVHWEEEPSTPSTSSGHESSAQEEEEYYEEPVMEEMPEETSAQEPQETSAQEPQEELPTFEQRIQDLMQETLEPRLSTLRKPEKEIEPEPVLEEVIAEAPEPVKAPVVKEDVQRHVFAEEKQEEVITSQLDDLDFDLRKAVMYDAVLNRPYD